MQHTVRAAGSMHSTIPICSLAGCRLENKESSSSHAGLPSTVQLDVAVPHGAWPSHAALHQRLLIHAALAIHMFQVSVI